jgi:hypothetical protein
MIVCPICKNLQNMQYQDKKISSKTYFCCYCGGEENDMNRDFYGNVEYTQKHGYTFHDYTLWLKINNGESKSFVLSADAETFLITAGGDSHYFKTKSIIQPEAALELLKKYLKMKAFL